MNNTPYDTNISPTAQTYKTLNNAYDYFNRELFEGSLPPCLITLQRKSKARGYFCAERFETRQEEKYYTHEIALNPNCFKDRTDEDIISTLVHEMVHVWQEEHGHPSRGGYHNSEWADKMEDIGLIPSNTEEEGGRRTGNAMSHYIDPNGRFSRYAGAFLSTVPPLQYQDRPVPKKPSKSKNKVKYTCPKCLLNAWGKENIKIVCGNDNSLLIEAPKG